MTLISVVITSKDKNSSLEMVLRSLLNQTYRNFEIIIVNDGMENIEVARLTDGIKIRLINNKKNYGVSYSRNIGAKLALGELIVFIDDDRMVTKNNLAYHLGTQKNNRRSIVVGNRWELFNFVSKKKYIQLFDMFETDLSSIKKREEPLSKIFKEIYLYNSKHPSLFLLCLTGNTSIWKKDFIKMVGFDENLQRLEDVDFGYRFLKEGGQVIYNEKIDSFHLPHKRLNYQEITKRSLDYLADKYPEPEMDLEDLLNAKISLNEYFKINFFDRVPKHLNKKIIYYR